MCNINREGNQNKKQQKQTKIRPLLDLKRRSTYKFFSTLTFHFTFVQVEVSKDVV